MYSLLNKILFLLPVFVFASCSSISTNNPTECYKNWTGQNPPKDMQLINGQYWQSGHWSREYIVYLKLRPSQEWWKEYIKQNNLVNDSLSWTPPTDAPKWFIPSIQSTKWKTAEDFQGSRYFQETLTGDCYIYEIQL